MLVDAIREGDKLRFYVLSDRLQTEKVTLHLALTDFQGKVIRRHRVEGMLPVNASEVFFEEDWQKAFEGCDTIGFVHPHDAQGRRRTEGALG